MKRGLLALFLWPLAVLADERILDFHSDIVVHADGHLEITETISVRAEGKQIRRGIYRDFPTDYVDRFGNRVSAHYEPKSVLRNSRSEDSHSEKHSNGVRTYFGSANRLLENGKHTYMFRYDASRMLGFFDDHDELYWNVTGNGWSFPVDRASARVTLAFDGEPEIIELLAFRGATGSTEVPEKIQIAGAGRAEFETRGLQPYEGLTVVVTWPKGHVAAPTTLDRVSWLLADNKNLLVALAGLLALLSYYLPVWYRFGRDPEAGVLVTRYVPPRRFSPASLRYIERMSYDDTAMTAAVVNLAVKGYLRINTIDDEHTLSRTDPGQPAPELADGERALLDALFEQGDYVVLENKNHQLLGAARSAHRASLKRDYKNRYFVTNTLLSLPGILVGLLAGIVAVKIGGRPSIFVIGVIAAMVVTAAVFASLLRRPTGIGRKLLNELAGFREYLEIAEKDEMNLRNPPEKTPELFEKYLPFALAIGVEQNWTERFAKVFARLRGPDGQDYHPSWYNGSWNNFDLSSNTASLASGLGSAISSSVTAPGSSSGSGGGGSSGGGGGGGGGGGW